MTPLDRLLAELPVEGTTFRPVSELARYVRGVTYAKSDERSSGPIRILRANNITLSSNRLNFDDVRTVAGTVRVSPEQYLKANDILLSVASGSRTHVGKVAFVESDLDYCFGGFMAVLRSDGSLLPRFLFHLLASQRFADYLDSKLDSTTINNLTWSVMGSFRVPVPPLAVQSEIIRMLEYFGDLEAEIEAELKARGQQLSQYQRALTSPVGLDGIAKPGWRIAKVGELCRVEKGKTAIQKATAGPYPLVATSEQRQSSSGFDFDGEAVCVPLISSKGHGVASISRIFFQSGKFALGTILSALIPNDAGVLSAEFLYRYLQTRVDTHLVPLMRGGANVSLTVQSLKSVPIHVPPIAEQRRIAETLNVLRSIVDDQEFGLPAELAARRKQYQYYRDKLLTFEEAPA